MPRWCCAEAWMVSGWMTTGAGKQYHGSSLQKPSETTGHYLSFPHPPHLFVLSKSSLDRTCAHKPAKGTGRQIGRREMWVFTGALVQPSFLLS
ncbi:hypothetical protein R3I93_017188 [Phoxinus phoxinus]|uniref:Uncharacterized protein n=1 Tax=Phoxinus phoxinus TaxID=58324 RepID=A0AAN9GYM6_9TELE